MYGGTLCIAQEQQFSPNNNKLEGGGGKKYIDMPLTISIGVFATNMN